MSRTFRRKDYEKTRGSSWERQHDKIAGYYTKYEYCRVEDDKYRWYEEVWREPTKSERYKMVRWAHGESRTSNERTPSRWFRQDRMNQNRMINKRELIKWLKNAEYDPIFESDPRSHYWDWD